MQRIIYLNNAATSYPKPRRVLQRVAELLDEPPFHHARAGFDKKERDALSAARVSVAELFNVQNPDRICFSSGATESLNLVLRGSGFEGKHVITTAVEHNSVLRPLKTMERDHNLSCTIIGCDKFGVVSVADILSAIREDTAAVVVNHCSNVTGAVTDIEKIGALTKSYGIPFIVDAAQSAGIYPIDVEKMNIDTLVFTGHKALGAMQGIGGAYISEKLCPQPIRIGGTGVRSDYPFQPETVPMYYEGGTQNIPGAASLAEGIKYINETGMASIRNYKETLTAYMQKELSLFDRVRCIPGVHSGMKTTLFSFTVDGMDPADIGYILEGNFGIVTRTGLHCAPCIHSYTGTLQQGTVRISPSGFTTEADACTFIEAMKQINAM